MPELKLNKIQLYRLYQYVEKQGKGATHLRRVQRLFTSWGIEAIEDTFEKNQDTITQFSADGKAVPKGMLVAFRSTDPAQTVTIEEGDLDKVWDYVQKLKKDSEADTPKGVDDPQDWRLWLPVFDEVDAAYNLIKEKKETSKSVAEEAKSNGTQPQPTT